MANAGVSQAIFLDGGKIEFERKTNIHRLYLDWENEDGTESSWMEQFKKMIPQFRVDHFELVFSNNRTVYKMSQESPDQAKFAFFGEGLATSNVVYKDLQQHLYTSQKQVFDSKTSS
jgi:hypothetical protein